MGRYCVESHALTDAKRKINIRRAGATRHDAFLVLTTFQRCSGGFHEQGGHDVGYALALSAAALAQMEMPKPAPELKKLDMFAGTWKLDGDIEPGPMGPGGKMSGQENCAWMDGGFYLVCNSTFKGPLGNATGTSYFGYSNDDKAYTYREFNSMGEFTDARGTVDGDVWTWNSEDKMNGQTMKGRFVVKVTSPTAYD